MVKMAALVFSLMEHVSVTFFFFFLTARFTDTWGAYYLRQSSGGTLFRGNTVHLGDLSTGSTVDPVQGSGNMLPRETSA